MALHRLVVFVLVLDFQYILIKCNKCVTTEESLGDNKGLPCIFPFVVGGKTYNECTTYLDPERKLWCATETDGSSNDACTTKSNPHNRFWCSTKVDRSGKHVNGNWGYCSEECFSRCKDGEELCKPSKSKIEFHQCIPKGLK